MIARRDLLRCSLLALLPFSARAAVQTSGQISLAAPRLSALRIASDGKVQVEVDATNVGGAPTQMLMHVYVHDQVASVVRPPLTLAATQPIMLRPNERRTVRFTLGPEAFHLPVRDGKSVVEPGLFDIMVGANSHDLKSATLEIV